jgi:prephenate dehydrogenase
MIMSVKHVLMKDLSKSLKEKASQEVIIMVKKIAIIGNGLSGKKMVEMLLKSKRETFICEQCLSYEAKHIVNELHLCDVCREVHRDMDKNLIIGD